MRHLQLLVLRLLALRHLLLLLCNKAINFVMNLFANVKKQFCNQGSWSTVRLPSAEAEIAMDDVTDIKELVTQALTRKRVLSKLRVGPLQSCSRDAMAIIWQMNAAHVGLRAGGTSLSCLLDNRRR